MSQRMQVCAGAGGARSSAVDNSQVASSRAQDTVSEFAHATQLLSLCFIRSRHYLRPQTLVA